TRFSRDWSSDVCSSDLQYGTVRRPRLGVFIETPNEADAAAYGLERAAGAEITSVQENSPAARAGLKMGDVVIAVDGRPIETSSRSEERRVGNGRRCRRR